MVNIVDEFRAAARRARRLGVRILLVDMSNGTLLASFLSPLSNRRTDRYGGSIEARLRLPLEVLDAVVAEAREATGDPTPVVGARLNCDDCAPGGFGPDDAVEAARAARARGCDLIEVAAGGTVPGGQPDYRRLFLAPHADRVRNEAGLPVMVGGNIAKADDANTILAAGRADLCAVDPRLYAFG